MLNMHGGIFASPISPHVAPDMPLRFLPVCVYISIRLVTPPRENRFTEKCRLSASHSDAVDHVQRAVDHDLEFRNPVLEAPVLVT